MSRKHYWIIFENAKLHLRMSHPRKGYQHFALLGLLFAICFLSQDSYLLKGKAQGAYPGRGAMSAQDLAHYAAPTIPLRNSGSSAADQVCMRYAPGSVVSAPPELRSQNGVLQLTLTIQSVTDSEGIVRLCYITDTGLLGPTLRVNPGDTLMIHFVNLLPSDFTDPDPDAMAGMQMAPRPNDFFQPCSGDNAMVASVTNLHFHGLNVSPVCGQDEVVRTLIHAQQTFDYAVEIPKNEPPGLYWYHPHPHGFSEGQVQGGATGALIVEGLQKADPALANLPERTFVIRDQVLPASKRSIAGVPAWDFSINYVPVTYPSYTPAVIQTNPGQKELWRVVNTAADLIVDLKYVVNGVPQTLQVVAIDGYPIAAGSSGKPCLDETSILLPPGARAEFVVTTPETEDKAQLLTDYWNTGPGGDNDPARPVADIVSRPGAENVSGLDSARVRQERAGDTSRPLSITRFAGLAEATPVEQRTLYFSEMLVDAAKPQGAINFFITEEGQQPAIYTMKQKPNIVVHSGTVEDWVVENRSPEDHAFHIHQIHFQVIEVDGQKVSDPALRDTIDIPFWDGSGPYHSVKLRMDFRDPNIIGTFVYHCHILEHEDGGMMGAIEVLKPGSPSATTAVVSSANLAPNGSLTMSANVVDSNNGKEAPTGLVQFQWNGANLNDPVGLTNGQASLTTSINGSAGANDLTAFYMGDLTYAESVSPPVTVSIPDFALASSGMVIAAGATGLRKVQVSVAGNVVKPIYFACALPTALTESMCTVSPDSLTGNGQVTLSVATTAGTKDEVGRNQTHRVSNLLMRGGTVLACLFPLLLSRRKRWGSWLSLLVMAGLFSAIGCSSPKINPGTATGTFLVQVTATGSVGSSSYQTSINIPVTIQ